MKLYSVNISPLLRVIKRFDLDRDTFFDIIFDFLSHQREEVLNLRLYQRYGFTGDRIKEEIRPILYTLLNELHRSDNVEGYFVNKTQLYVKDGDYEYDHEHDDARTTEIGIQSHSDVSRRSVELAYLDDWPFARRLRRSAPTGD